MTVADALLPDLLRPHTVRLRESTTHERHPTLLSSNSRVYQAAIGMATGTPALEPRRGRLVRGQSEQLASLPPRFELDLRESHLVWYLTAATWTRSAGARASAVRVWQNTESRSSSAEFGADAVAGMHSEYRSLWSENTKSKCSSAFLEYAASCEFVVAPTSGTFARFKVGHTPERHLETTKASSLATAPQARRPRLRRR